MKSYYVKNLIPKLFFLLLIGGIAFSTGGCKSKKKLAEEAAAKEYAEKALSINNNIAESHATMGALLAYGQWKWHEGEIEFKQAIALKPNYDTAHEYYSMLLDVEGRHAEARREIDIALQLNPHSITINQLSAIYYFRSEDYEKALEKNIKNQTQISFQWKKKTILVLVKFMLNLLFIKYLQIVIN